MKYLKLTNIFAASRLKMKYLNNNLIKYKVMNRGKFVNKGFYEELFHFT